MDKKELLVHEWVRVINNESVDKKYGVARKPHEQTANKTQDCSRQSLWLQENIKLVVLNEKNW